MAENKFTGGQLPIAAEDPRPALLDGYFAPLDTLKGFGTKLIAPLKGLIGPEDGTPSRVVDLLFHLPTSTIDRRLRTTIADAPEGAIVTLIGRIEAHRHAPPGRSRMPHRVVVGDESGELLLVYFGQETGWIERSMPVGSERLISGVIESFDGVKQIVHPAFVVDPQKPGGFSAIESVYPLKAGVTSRFLHRVVRQAFSVVKELPEWLSPDVVAGLPSFLEALRKVHQPSTPDEGAANSAAGRRLAVDSFFASQLALALLRRHTRQRHGRAMSGDGHLVEPLIAALPYTLTSAQVRSLAAVHGGMAAAQAMLHLLQGDVGSGKTVVAMLAMARAIEAGHQAALMAPTDILARQHHATLTPLLRRVDIEPVLLTGRERAVAKDKVLAGLADGRIRLVIGTHALLQEDVRFADLGLAVIDEQHRFGVNQRLALTTKGEAVDLLLTTATPIPRTLVLAYYGDMDVSKLDEKPPGRQKIATRAMPLTRLDEVVDGLGRALEKGARAYWVCPTIADESEEESGVAQRAASLEAHFPGLVSLLHSRLPQARREKALADFSTGTSRILVATTVIEVGVDVPDATIMIIEQADKFGLSQLHQLRGRVGRGTQASSCVLLYDPDLSETAKERLQVIRDSEDGFYIAEADLRLRGPGEVLGARQSGLPSLPLVTWEAHVDLLPTARSEARALIAADPLLTSPRGQAARLALHLFGQQRALRYLLAG
ncbi:MAG: ATP-dependent DNA helicase RecG [Hyphomicrobiales bacterium]|nr:ATP-dependent DNA helicase RecG [Hyphomicrobiales bacterium]OQW83167.1 MAG: ATP-dependent DNA helicase RecG [Proteobacteria bacterium ST_bin15]